MDQDIPSQAKKYFWGDDLSQLDFRSHQRYIIQTLLNKGDVNAISWLFGSVGVDTIKTMLPQLKLDEKSRNYWNIYFS